MSVLDTMQAKVDAMPLSTWLYAIHRAIPHIGKDHAMREFVSGLHERGLIYHFDDCAVDCLVDSNTTHATRADAELINKIVCELYCEDMFTLAMQLSEDAGKYCDLHQDTKDKCSCG